MARQLSRHRLARKGRFNHAYMEFLEARVLFSAVNTAKVSLSTYFGGTANDGMDGPGAIAIDSSGNKLLGGWTESGDLPSVTNSNAGLSDDGYVTKFDQAGNLLWSTYVGGTTDDSEVTSIAVDGSGNTYATGFVDATDMTGALNSHNAAQIGPDDAFVAKIGPAGNIIWSLYLGGGNDDDGTGIAVDGSGNAYITGITVSSDFGGATGTFGGKDDGFVAKVDPSGTLQWATYFGGSDSDDPGGISVNVAGEALIAGTTGSKQLVGATNTYRGGFSDAFVAKFSAAGAEEWVTFLGGSGNEDFLNGDAGMAADVAWDTDGTAVVTGFTTSTNLVLAKNKPSGGGDAFITRIDGSGNVVWSDYLGGPKADNGEQVVLDSQHNAYVTGFVNYTSLTGTTMDAMVAKIDPSGNVDWVNAFGGSKNDHSAGAALDAAGNLWFAGETASIDLPLASNQAPGGTVSADDPFSDAFIAEIPAHAVGQPSKLVVGSVPKTAVAGAFPTVTVTLEYPTGAIVTNDTTSVTIALVGTNGATLGGTTTVQVINGVATFNDLAIGAVGTYTFAFSDLADGLAGIPSTAFTITPDVTSSQLVLVHQPGDTTVGLSLTPALVAEVEDRFGNVITTDHSAVHLSIVNGTTFGILTGTTTVNAVKGVATFSKAALTAAGSYTLALVDGTVTNHSEVQYTQVIDLATSTVATPKPITVTFGQTISFTAMFKSNAPASIHFAGIATIFDNLGNPLGSGIVTANGTVKFTIPTVFGGAVAIPANTYTVTVSYGGDAAHTQFTSGSFTLLIKPAATTTTLATPPASLDAGASLTFTATVASSGAPTVAPTGMVTFLDNGTAVGTVSLSGHTATFTYTPPPGVNKYTATYAGDEDFLGSSTTGVPKTVTDFLAPAGLSGDTIFLLGLTGTGSKAPPALGELDFAASGNSVSTGDFVSQQAGSAKYTYKRTGATTAILVTTGSGFSVTEQLTFATSDSATAQFKYGSGQTGTNQAAVFTPPVAQAAPASIHGGVFTLTAINGGGTVGSTGVLQLSLSASDNSYTLVSLSGPDVNTTGTGNYFDNNAETANITYVDSQLGTARIWLFFTSATTGFYYNLTDANGWQAGTFAYQPPAVG